MHRKNRKRIVFTIIAILALCLSPQSANASEPAAEKAKMVALTFDDGPGPHTEQLLDALAARNAKATFFLFGKKVTPETAPLLIRMLAEEHEIGSHTYNHTRLTTLSDDDIRRELDLTDKAIIEAVGIAPHLVRPPFGSYNDRVVAACNRPVILWSLDTRDWEMHEPQAVCQSITRNVKDGDVILLHDQEKSSIDGVIAAIDIMLDEGYTFVTVQELFDSRGVELVAGKYYHGG